jgi:hypothetical protein
MNPDEKKPTPEEIAAKQAELENIQSVLNETAQQLAQILYQRTGQPPKAMLLVVHFPQDVLYASTMATTATPQGAMNAIDAILAHMKKCGEKWKSSINLTRHGARPGESSH